MFSWSPIEEVVQDLCARRGLRSWEARVDADRAYLWVSSDVWLSSAIAPLMFKIQRCGRDVGVFFDGVHQGTLEEDDVTGWVSPVGTWLDRLHVLEVMAS